MLPIPKRVLLVDDYWRDIEPRFKQIFDRLGTTLDCATNEQNYDELKRVNDHANRWDLVILDYKLGESTGSVLLPKLRAELPASTILLYSGDPSAFSASESQQYDTAGFLTPELLASPHDAQDWILARHASFQLQSKQASTLKELLSALIDAGRTDWQKYLGDLDVTSVLAAIPEFTFGPGREDEACLASVLGKKQAVTRGTGVIFHGISPWGESITLLSPLGRDWRILQTLHEGQVNDGKVKWQGLHDHRLGVVFLQGPGLANLNSSIRRWCGALPIDSWAINACRRRRLYDLVGFRSLVIDLDGGPVVDFVVDLSYWMQLSEIALKGISREISGEKIRQHLDQLEPSTAFSQDQYQALGRTDELVQRDFATVVSAMKNLVNLTSTLDEGTLKYFFRAGKLLELLPGPLLRLGPFTEKYFDGLAHRDRKEDFSAFYAANYRLSGRACLPYCLLSDELKETTFDEAKNGHILISVDCSADEVEQCLSQTRWLDACRTIADLLSFVAAACSRNKLDKTSKAVINNAVQAVDPELRTALDLASKDPTSPAAKAWIRKNGAAMVPLHFRPYLLASRQLYSREMAELVAEIVRWTARKMEPP